MTLTAIDQRQLKAKSLYQAYMTLKGQGIEAEHVLDEVDKLLSQNAIDMEIEDDAQLDTYVTASYMMFRAQIKNPA